MAAGPFGLDAAAAGVKGEGEEGEGKGEEGKAMAEADFWGLGSDGDGDGSGAGSNKERTQQQVAGGYGGPARKPQEKAIRPPPVPSSRSKASPASHAAVPDRYVRCLIDLSTDVCLLSKMPVDYSAFL